MVIEHAIEIVNILLDFPELVYQLHDMAEFLVLDTKFLHPCGSAVNGRVLEAALNLCESGKNPIKFFV